MVRILEFESSDVGSNPAWLADLWVCADVKGCDVVFPLDFIAGLEEVGDAEEVFVGFWVGCGDGGGGV